MRRFRRALLLLALMAMVASACAGSNVDTATVATALDDQELASTAIPEASEAQEDAADTPAADSTDEPADAMVEDAEPVADMTDDAADDGPEVEAQDDIADESGSNPEPAPAPTVAQPTATATAPSPTATAPSPTATAPSPTATPEPLDDRTPEERAAANIDLLETASNPFDIEVLDVADGRIQSLRSAADGDRPVLLWFWAPH